MVNIVDRNGNIFLEANDYDLKIDVNRVVYIKRKGKDNVFKSLNAVLEVGLTSEEKKKYLYNLYKAIEDRRNSQREEEEGEKEPI